MAHLLIPSHGLACNCVHPVLQTCSIWNVITECCYGNAYIMKSFQGPLILVALMEILLQVPLTTTPTSKRIRVEAFTTVIYSRFV